MIKNSPQIREQYLEHVIDTTLMAEAASATKVEESEAFKRRMAEVKKEILSKMYWEQRLAEESTEAKLKAYFESHKDRFSDLKVRAAHILLPGDQEAKAQDVLKQALAKDADFTALAKLHSTGPGNQKSGDLGFFGRGRMLPEFEAAAFSTPKGQVHPKLVKTDFGYHIIKVIDVQGAAPVSFADKKDDVAREVERELRMNLQSQLRTKAKVQVNSDAIKSLKF
jgi:peptidyl-prolyl cis-trans isomerase C